MHEYVNKLFLIGNGFDLAHGLNTSYSDFIDSLWVKEKETIFCDNSYYPIYTGVGGIVHGQDGFLFKGDLITFKSNNIFSKNRVTHQYSVKGFDFFKKYIITNSKTLLAERKEDRSDIQMSIMNSFLQIITERNYIDNYLYNWVDIENEYYNELKKCFKKANEGAFSANDMVIKLNKDFFQIRNWLEDYLFENANKPVERNPQILEIMNKIIQPNIFPGGDSINEKDKIMFVNFNYTDTQKAYIDYFRHYIKQTVDCIHIHGKLKEPKNPIIFGYGDEMDDEYIKLENTNDKNYLANIKSMKYLQTPNYRNLLLFLDSYDFEVFVLGHSCGLSDRTLLNTIFEHDNCKRIKIFYHQRKDGTDDFDEKIMNIYRNFKKKQSVRAKVVPKSNCEPLIELTKEFPNASND